VPLFVLAQVSSVLTWKPIYRRELRCEYDERLNMQRKKMDLAGWPVPMDGLAQPPCCNITCAAKVGVPFASVRND